MIYYIHTVTVCFIHTHVHTPSSGSELHPRVGDLVDDGIDLVAQRLDLSVPLEQHLALVELDDILHLREGCASGKKY